jgi:hypothetical protein
MAVTAERERAATRLAQIPLLTVAGHAGTAVAASAPPVSASSRNASSSPV